MKKITLKFLTSLLFLLIVPFAAARGNYYLEAGVGYFKPKDFKDVPFSGSDDRQVSYYSKGHNSGSAVFTLGAGKYLPKNFRTDLKFAYRPHFRYKNTSGQFSPGGGAVKQNVAVMTFLQNLYYDTEKFHGVSAYAVGGIGIAIIRAGKYNIDYGDNLRACAPQSESYAGKTTNNFAWNIGTGASVELWENGYADLGYRYVQMGRFNMTSAKKTTRPTDSDQEVGGSRNFSSKIAAHEWSLSLRVGL